MNDLTREIYGNIDGRSQFVFYLLTLAALVIFGWGVWRRVRRWRLRRGVGPKPDWRSVSGRLFGKVFLQRSVRGGPRRLAGWAHTALFVGFGILFVGTLLVSLEHWSAAFLGLPPGQPLFHRGLYYAVFELTLDIGGLLLIAGCLFFIWRAMRGTTSMANGPADWAVVLTLLLLGVTGYVVEGARILLEQTPMPGLSPVGLLTATVLDACGLDSVNLPAFHRVTWWLHAIGALGLIASIPYSRLLHIVSGAANISLRDYELGRMDPVSIETVEETGQFGVGRAQDLSGGQLLALDACVSCGRCQDACPAFAAGKPLSPRNLVQDIRAQVDQLDFAALSSSDPLAGRSLHGDVISAETLWACTTCGACVTSCPVEVAPMDFITDLRRFLVAEGDLRGTPAASLQKMQRSGNPWGLAQADRFAWAEGLEVPTVKDNPDFEILYWVGCAAAYDPRTARVARALIGLLQRAGVDFACLGPEEKCTGDSARRMGDEFLFQELAMENVGTLNRHRVKRIVTHCPHCLNALKRDYSQFGGDYEVVHHSELLANLVADGRLSGFGTHAGSITYHDPCYLARVNGIEMEPRSVLGTTGATLTEMPRRGCNTACCGGGGGRMWFDDQPSERTGQDRIDEALDAGVGTIAVSCPFCLTMMADGVAAKEPGVAVKDVAEILADAMKS